MSKALLALAILACASGLAAAGPNRDGTILVHYAPASVPPDPTYVEGGLTSCDAAVTTAPADEPILWFAYAAFPSCASPRLKVVTLGCTFDASLIGILWTATRPLAMQIFYPDQASWPYPGSGVAVGFDDTLTETIDEIYCFAGYGSAGAAFCLAPHPDPMIGGTFAHDLPPGDLDMIAGYGCLGFGAPGSPACAEESGGACCYPDGRCEFRCEWGCGETFLGRDIPCAPSICEESACCLGGTCVFLLEGECLAHGGEVIDGPCVPNPCEPPTPARQASWGRLKELYR